MDIFDELKDNQRLYNTYMVGDAELAKAKYREAKALSLNSKEIDAKTTELIVLAIAITAKCEGCIASHARAAVRAGATMEEIGSLILICNHMVGSVGAFFGGKALRHAEIAMQELKAEQGGNDLCEQC